MHQKDLDLLFNENLGLVNKMVSKMDYGLINRDDLYQAGCLGLFYGLKKYDEKKGKLSSYVVPYIIGEIKNEIGNHKLVKISKSLKKIKKQINLEKSIDENAKEMNVSRENIILAMQYEEGTVEIDDKGYIENRINFDCLEILERRIIELKYIKNVSQEDIASMYNISQSKVSRIIKESLKKLRTEV
ncbi:sigma-70 family RNA polymerase sigma factor [Mycoplasmatota bacterium WC44]